jgi:hypothetical protein
MTSGLVQRTGVKRARHSIHLPALACLLLVAGLLPSVLAPDTAQAKNAAFVSSTAGPRAEVVDGVPLVPTTRAQRGECQKFADHLKRPVPCPGLLPDPIPVSVASASGSCLGQVGALGEGSCGPAGMQLDGNLFELSQSNFKVPSGYVGVSYQQYSGAVVPETSISGGSLGHFVFMTGTDLAYVMTHKRGQRVVPVPPYCSPFDSARPIRVHGRLAKLYQCADALPSLTEVETVLGHSLLVWNDAGIACEVSFHGHSRVNVDLDIAMANATVLVASRKR